LVLFTAIASWQGAIALVLLPGLHCKPKNEIFNLLRQKSSGLQLL
jgi:hypothetical protein